MAEQSYNLKDAHILLGVSGGVAAYKAVDLASKLRAAQAKVQTVMTESACRLVTSKSFEAVTGSAVYTSMWDTSQQYDISHISLVEWADIVVVAPATANIIGKAANGICDDLLSTVLCVCWAKPTLFASAMNNNMWTNPIVQRNVEKLKEAGFKFVGPEVGRLACGTDAIGRMAEPQTIIGVLENIVAELKSKH